MVFPDVAGTAFSIEIATGYPGIHIAALYGLGEGLVSGEVTSDEWLFNRGNLKLIKRNLGFKNYKYASKKDGSGIERVKISKEMANRFCIE